jgi:hypothetical protein
MYIMYLYMRLQFRTLLLPYSAVYHVAIARRMICQKAISALCHIYPNAHAAIVLNRIMSEGVVVL